MSTYLTVDIGNSSVKAAVWRDGQLLGDAISGALTGGDIDHLCAVTNGKFDCAAICSVSADTTGIVAAAEAMSHKVIEVDATTPVPVDLSHYTSGSTLGSDRIAALVGARALHPDTDLLVVDCGTAVTYDRLTADGVFLGGNIAPGIGMRLRALHTFTSRLPQVETKPTDKMWGLSTSEAMRAGAFRGVLAEVEYYYRQCPEGTIAVLSGGRARDLFLGLPFPTTIDPNLVLRGLNHIIIYNEGK